ncbi:MAG TPA: LysM domain-containing protein [Tepidisphaeraceae bacterium]
MRKEVKLGMALGGGLIALLIAYLLVAPPTSNKRGAVLAGADHGSIIDAGAASGDVAATPVDDKASAATADPNPNQSAQVQAGKGQQESRPPAPTENASGGRGSLVHNGSTDQWNILRTGKAPKTGAGTPPAAKDPVIVLAPPKPAADKPTGAEKHEVKTTHTEVASAAGGHEAVHHEPVRQQPKVYFSNPNDAWGDGVSTPGASLFATDAAGTPASPAHKGSAKSRNTTADRPADSTASTAAAGETLAPSNATPVAGSTHVVRSGETFSSIAAVAYGSAAYYPHLIRANPQVNPNNLKLGTVINLPRLEDVKATTGTGGDHATGGSAQKVIDDVKIDPAKQYRVQSGDSLYKISQKIYGTPNYLEAIYEQNKQAIGPNPTKLKLGMILDLPERPVNLAAPAEPQTTSTLSGESGVSGSGEQR